MRKVTMPMTEESLLTIDGTAKLLNVSRSTVLRLGDRGILQILKIGGARRVTPAEIRRVLADSVAK